MQKKQSFEEAVGYFSRGLYHKALAAFREIVRRESAGDTAPLTLSRDFILESYKMLAARYISQGILNNARNILTEALEEYPGNHHLLFYQAVTLNNAMNFPEAVTAFGVLYKENPDFPAIRIAFGIALLNLGHLSRVEQLLRNAIAMPPHDATLYHLLAICDFRLNRFPEAESCLLRAIELKQPYPDAQTSLAALYLNQNRHEDALTILSELLPFLKDKTTLRPPLAFLAERLSIDRDTPIIRDNLASPAPPVPTAAEIKRWTDQHFYRTIPIDILALPILDSEGEFLRHGWFRNLLIRHYSKMLKEGMDIPEIHFRLGREYQRMRKFKEAIGHFDRCLEQNPTFVPAKISRAFAYRDLGKLEVARQQFEEIYEAFRTLPDMIMRSSEARMTDPVYSGKEKELDAELKILLMAVRQNPHFADLYYNIGRIYFQKDDPEKALDYFNKACTLNPNFIRSNIGKSIALMQLGQMDNARDILNHLSGNTNLFIKIVHTLAALYHQSGQEDRARLLLNEVVAPETGPLAPGDEVGISSRQRS